jgi:hypothetical protein
MVKDVLFEFKRASDQDPKDIQEISIKKNQKQRNAFENDSSNRKCKCLSSG